MSKPSRTPRLMLALPVALALATSACSVLTPRPHTAVSCASMIPEDYKTHQAPVPLPTDNTLGSWIAFGIAQTAAKETAEDRWDAVLTIVGTCDKINTH